MLAALLLTLLPWAASAQLAAIPPLSDRVHDTTLTLGTSEREALVAKLKAFEQRKGSQIAVLIVSSTQPEDITSYAIRAAQTYKLGRPGVGDGILIVVAKDDRRARIDVAKALEGAVPDVAAGRIVRETLRPAFKDGRYGDGLMKGTDQLIGLIDGEALPPAVQRSQAQQMPDMFGGIDWADLGIFLFMAVIVGGSALRAVFGRGFGSLLTAGAAGGVAWWFTASVLLAGIAGVVALVVSLFTALGSALSQAANRASGARRSRRGGWDAPVVWGGGGGGGWSGGGRGGGIDLGGFSSGGGGDFGGGGASGDW